MSDDRMRFDRKLRNDRGGSGESPSITAESTIAAAEDYPQLQRGIAILNNLDFIPNAATD